MLSVGEDLDSTSGSSEQLYESDTSTSSMSDDWLHQFSIPWNKFPVDLLDKCEKDEKPKHLDRLEMVRVLVDGILIHTKKPKKKALEYLASKIVSKYPESFQDRIGGKCIGSGYSSLSNQLVFRVDNAIRRVNKYLDTEIMKKRKALEEEKSYGCKDWQPSIYNEDDMVTTKTLLQEKFKTGVPLTEVENKMKETYPLQRKDINSNNLISDLQKEWPYLFLQPSMFQHFSKLVSMDSNKTDLAKEFWEKSLKVYK